MNPPHNPQQPNERDRDPLDSVLAEWSANITCSEAHADAMWKRVSETLMQPLTDEVHREVAPIPASRRTWSQLLATRQEVLWGMAALAAGVVVWLGIGAYFARNSTSVDAIAHIPRDPLKQFAFTSEELQANQTLACEVSLLYRKPVLVQRTSTGWDIDEEPSSGDLEETQRAQRMLLRCVLLQASAATPSGGWIWREVHREEFISGHDHQFAMQAERASSLSTWAHVLPNQQLWAEIQSSDGGQSQLLRPNEPVVLWESQQSDTPRRLVVVYELLDACDARAML